MRLRSVVVVLVTVIVLAVLFPDGVGIATSSGSSVPPFSDVVVQRMDFMPLSFTKNMGQWDDRVLFRTSVGCATVWFTREGITYQFVRRIPHDAANPPDSLGSLFPLGRKVGPKGPHAAKRDSVEVAVLHAKFVNPEPGLTVETEGMLEYKCNFLLGNDPAKWRTDVPNFTRIVYHDVYPGVDVYFEVAPGRLRTRWEVHDGSDRSKVRFEYEGNARVSETQEGEPVIEVPWGAVFQSAPEASQEVSEVAACASGAAVTLIYSTFLGGCLEDEGRGVAVDASGNAFVTGSTFSIEFTVENPPDTCVFNISSDCFVARLLPPGNALAYLTFFGGSSDDWGSDIAIDGSGSAHIAGLTGSSDFPVMNPLQGVFAGEVDAFVTKLSPSGAGFEYSTYLGGSSGDVGTGVAVDGFGSAYVTGYTRSGDFPTVNAFQPMLAWPDDFDNFVTKLNQSGSSFVYSTFLGGVGPEDLSSIAVDLSGCAHVVGATYSTNFPTVNAVQPLKAGDFDAFITKLSAGGTSLVYSTYLGGTEEDAGRDVDVDASGRTYVAGQTRSNDFPVVSPVQQSNGGGTDAFVAVLASSGSNLDLSSYFGGSENEYAFGAAVDTFGNLYLTGYDESDAFVSKIGVSGGPPVYCARLGGGSVDWALGVAVDGNGDAYVTGGTLSSDFPTSGPYDGSYNGNLDAFVVKLRFADVCGELAYQPNPDGWAFPNTQLNMWPQTWWQQFDYSVPEYPFAWRFFCRSSDFPDWPLFVRAFGESYCYWDPPPGLVVYRPSAVARWFELKGDWGGACFGFATSAFLLFDQFWSVSAEFPGANTLYEVPIGSESRLMINELFLHQFGQQHQEHIWSRRLSATPETTLIAVQDMFARTNRNDQILVFFNGDPTRAGGHAVNPYRCELDALDPQITHIYVYDNNAPGDLARRVSVNTVTDSWTFNGFSPAWYGTRDLFLMEPISNYLADPILPASIPRRRDWIAAAQQSQSDAVTVYLPSTAHVTLQSSYGSIGREGDSLFGDVSAGMPIIPITGAEEWPIGYLIEPGDWDLTLSGVPDTALSVTFFADGTVLSYSRTEVAPTESDNLRFNASDSALMISNPELSPRTVMLSTIAISPDSEIVCVARNLSVGGSDSLLFRLTEDEGIQLDNYGGASTYGLRVEIASGDGKSVFYNRTVDLLANASHRVLPDWRQTQDNIVFLVDRGMTGAYADTLTFANQGDPDCECDCHADPAGCNGVLDITDVVQVVNVSFRGQTPLPDPNTACPYDMTDVNCTGTTDVVDVVKIVNVAFRGANPATEFCNPCP